MFLRNERSIREFRQLYPIVFWLIVIHLVLWLIINFLQLPIGVELYTWGLGVNFLVAEGELWRLVTPIFLHGDLMHAVFNSFSLVLFGPALEQMLGKGRFLFVYFGAGILANIATFILGPLDMAHLGASGAIFGLFGVYTYMYFFRKDLLDYGSSQVIMPILVIGLIMTFLNPGINIYAHVFGFVGGFVLASSVLKYARPYFYIRTESMSHPTEPGDVQFNPNRWRKRRLLSPKMKKNLPWIIIGALAILGLLSRL